jgi:hypothetical protein
MTIGDRTLVRPFPYDLLLNRAHARVFNLQRRIEETRPEIVEDVDIKDILQQPSLEDSFGQSNPLDVE